jgi:hypothetical protein
LIPDCQYPNSKWTGPPRANWRRVRRHNACPQRLGEVLTRCTNMAQSNLLNSRKEKWTVALDDLSSRRNQRDYRHGLLSAHRLADLAGRCASAVPGSILSWTPDHTFLCLRCSWSTDPRCFVRIVIRPGLGPLASPAPDDQALVPTVPNGTLVTAARCVMRLVNRWLALCQVRSRLSRAGGQSRFALRAVPRQPASIQFVNPPHSAFGILVAPLGRGR